MKSATARQMVRMLAEVVGPKGTAPQAAVDGYKIAGKTGTAKKSIAGGYQEDDYVAVFAGLAPASNPRLVMAVMIDEPTQNGYYGGLVAAPVFQEVMSNALRILDVPPDDLPILALGEGWGAWWRTAMFPEWRWGMGYAGLRWGIAGGRSGAG
mgnify:CR=1 FL=1